MQDINKKYEWFTNKVKNPLFSFQGRISDENWINRSQNTGKCFSVWLIDVFRIIFFWNHIIQILRLRFLSSFFLLTMSANFAKAQKISLNGNVIKLTHILIRSANGRDRCFREKKKRGRFWMIAILNIHHVKVLIEFDNAVQVPSISILWQLKLEM